MDVVLLGSAIPGIHAIGRSLGRALDATVIDGDRLRRRVGSVHGWLEALRAELPRSRSRPHAVATCTTLTPDERAALRRHGMCLVVLCGLEAGVVPDEPDEPDVRLVIDPRGSVEQVAARVLGSLVLRLEPAQGAAPPDRDWSPHGDDVS